MSEQRETEKQLDAQGWSDVPNERHHVYAAGLIAWCLMRNAQLRTSSDTTPQLPFPGATGVANPTAYFDPQHHSAFYSMALERVVEKCMCIDWRERHSLDQIFEEVTEGLAKFQSVHEGIESMSNEELPPWMRVDLGEDISKIGSSFSDYLAAIQARITREEMNSTDSALL
ncbi:hypothetical protein BU24DRAFT_420668 [Aaosphaeria arxii CBS 175.79]|uniref:Uncharacterized protein n=1 Tax=Aaosphaeria arxii CBS 175.79 TaxID=1450172 RepID=A0A6A5XWB8_9PLEO|nr:uncharacterized protein BU24DRAFT_420668 [Aaosphaeria arxii CBS 175.79]KAF2017625.1 hypothetical protein BU24DRAFT_420668 [Aaosphaeria arxii CBS 175.79]